LKNRYYSLSRFINSQ